jgi:hypothetical protein
MRHLKNFRLFESLDANLISELQASLNKASYDVPLYVISPEGDAVKITKSTDEKSIKGIVKGDVIEFQGVDGEVSKWLFASGEHHEKTVDGFKYLANWIVEASPIKL